MVFPVPKPPGTAAVLPRATGYSRSSDALARDERERVVEPPPGRSGSAYGPALGELDVTTVDDRDARFEAVLTFRSDPLDAPGDVGRNEDVVLEGGALLDGSEHFAGCDQVADRDPGTERPVAAVDGTRRTRTQVRRRVRDRSQQPVEDTAEQAGPEQRRERPVQAARR